MLGVLSFGLNLMGLMGIWSSVNQKQTEMFLLLLNGIDRGTSQKLRFGNCLEVWRPFFADLAKKQRNKP